MQYNNMNLTEHTDKITSLSEILIRFGVNYAINKSFVIVARFNGNQYFAMADDVADLMSNISMYFDEPTFEGYVYRVKDGRAVPVSCHEEFNIKRW